MIGLGTIINVLAILIAGILGLFAGGILTEEQQSSINMASGVSVLFIGIGGALQEMLSIEDHALVSGGSMMMIVSLVLGSLIGECFKIEQHMESFGEWLKARSGNASDAAFVNGFVTASLTVCIGAMAVVGSIQDGIYGNHSILFTKSILDFIIILIMASSLGKGCVFSAIPVGLFQGTITILATVLEPYLTDAALSNLSFVGSIMIFCVGVNLIFGKRIRVGNMLPGLIVAVIWSFL